MNSWGANVSAGARESFDEELEAMTPDERIRYLKDHEYAEKHGEPKKGSFLEKLIARGNKETEDQVRLAHVTK
jgi:hypothetical protein